MTSTPIAEMLRRRFPDITPEPGDQPTGQAELTEDEQREMHRGRALRRHNARVDPQFTTARLDPADRAPAARAVAEWTRRYQAGTLGPRHSLLLLGTVGTGKTWLAYAALRALAESGHPRVDWAGGTIAETYARLRPSSGENPAAVFDELATASVLLLDDLGATKHSDWTEETTLTLLDARYRTRRPVIATGNATPKELAVAIGDRALSRLVGMSVLVEVKGPDRRLA